VNPRRCPVRLPSSRLAPPLACGLLGLLVGILSGCQREGTTVTIPAPREISRPASGSDDFERAFHLIDQLDEFDPEQVKAQAAYHLTRWLASLPPATDWTKDPLVNESLGPLLNLRTLRNADAANVSRTDVRYLQETTWLRDIALWASSSPDQPLTAEVIEQAVQGLAEEQAEQLATALRLFDWTIRNIQLVPSPTPSDEITEPVTSERGEPVPPAARAIPGPGYTQIPWETLLFGRGDAWQRGRIYILLARQAGIDSFALARPATDSQPAPQPWVVGTRIGEEIYLFDPTLGLPLPGPDMRGVLTLGQLLQSPQLLESLDVGETLRYPLRPDQMEPMTVLLDASTESLSLRMHRIQERLTGTRRMILASEPSRIARDLEGLAGVHEVRLWSLPLETELFESALTELRRRDSFVDAAYQQKMTLFSDVSPLMTARQLYFRRQFERREEKPGAIIKYMETRLPERDIAAIPTSETVREKIGLTRSRAESEEAWQTRLAMTQYLFREGKHHASFWLGLVHLENADYDNAVSWFQRRTLDESPNSPWTDGARYNLARALEGKGLFAEARENYLLDESPQRHGNLLRARYLRLYKMTPTAG
jgi:hypothetical protein